MDPDPRDQIVPPGPFLPMPDGRRLLFVNQPDERSKIERIEVVLNWTEELQR